MMYALVAFLLVTTPTAPAPDPATEPEEVAPAPEEEVEEELICRVQRIPAERVGERFRKREVCKTREEWDADRRRRR